MKLNFWQWLGAIFFVVALALIIWRETTNSTPPTPMTGTSASDDSDTTSPSTTTAPATTAP